jgi:radical SAM family protein
LNCSYCLGGGKVRGASASPRTMSRETACRAVERACEKVSPGGVVEVAFYGGEPLRNWTLVKVVGDACKGTISGRFPDREIRLSMISNLAEAPDDLAAWALGHGMTFLCDIDGPGPVHDRLRPFADGTGSLATVTANVRRLVTAGVHVGLRMTLTALNQSDMVETARLFKDLGAGSCAFVPVQPVDCAGRFLPRELLPDIDAITAGMKQVYESGSGTWRIFSLSPIIGNGSVPAGCAGGRGAAASRVKRRSSLRAAMCTPACTSRATTNITSALYGTGHRSTGSAWTFCESACRSTTCRSAGVVPGGLSAGGDAPSRDCGSGPIPTPRSPSWSTRVG